MYTIFALFGIAVLYGMVRSWCFLHDKLQAFYTGHPRTGKFFEGKLHANSVFLSSLVIVLSVVAMLGFYTVIPGAHLAAGVALTIYLMIAVLDGINGIRKVAARISGGSNKGNGSNNGTTPPSGK
ncbi:MAG TPA: hypothetical protein V6C81_21425 [Planktothrix sp.]|jgi:hypothetical protein